MLASSSSPSSSPLNESIRVPAISRAAVPRQPTSAQFVMRLNASASEPFTAHAVATSMRAGKHAITSAVSALAGHFSEIVHMPSALSATTKAKALSSLKELESMNTAPITRMQTSSMSVTATKSIRFIERDMSALNRPSIASAMQALMDKRSPKKSSNSSSRL